MLQILVVLAGYLAGMLIYLPTEYKSGAKYYRALSDVLLSALIVLFLREHIHFAAALVFGILALATLKKVNSPWIAVIVIPIVLISNTALITSIALLYSIPSGTILRASLKGR